MKPEKNQTWTQPVGKSAEVKKTGDLNKPGGLRFKARADRLKEAIDAGTATKAMKKEYEKITGKKVK